MKMQFYYTFNTPSCSCHVNSPMQVILKKIYIFCDLFRFSFSAGLIKPSYFSAPHIKSHFSPSNQFLTDKIKSHPTIILLEYSIALGNLSHYSGKIILALFTYPIYTHKPSVLPTYLNSLYTSYDAQNAV